MVIKYKKEVQGLGDRIRKARGGSREELAVQAKISSTTLEKIETGEVKNPTAANVMDIAKCLGVRVEKLLGDRVVHKKQK